MVDQAELDQALDAGHSDELPPNVPPGMLGETPLDVRKRENWDRHGLSAGVVQEASPETRILTVLLLWALIVTSPVAFVLLWRDRAMSLVGKIVWTAVMTAGLAGVFYVARNGG